MLILQLMSRQDQVLQEVVIKFAGDSGDGMQLTGSQFTNNTALLGIDLATFPDFQEYELLTQGIHLSRFRILTINCW